MMYLLSLEFCETENVLRTFKILNIFITLMKILVPLVIIIVGMKDFFGVIVAYKDDEFKNTINQLVRRIIAGLIIFVLPAILNFAMDTYYGFKETTTKFASCNVCLTNTKECDDLIAIAQYKQQEQNAANHNLTAEENAIWERRNTLADEYIRQHQNDNNNNNNSGNSNGSSNNNSGGGGNYSNPSNTDTSTQLTGSNVVKGKYFDSTDVTKISGLSEEQFINILKNNKAYKGKVKMYIPYAHDLILAERNHGVNAFYLIGVYSLESGWLGSNLAKECNNIGGVKFYNQTYGNGKKVTNCRNGWAGYDSISEFIDYHASLLERNYLHPGAKHYNGKDVAGVGKDYGHGNSANTIIQIASKVSQ